MRKFIFALLAYLAMAGLVFADATYTSTNNAKGGNADYGYGAQVDQTNGYTQHIDSEGAGYVMEKVNEVVELIDAGDLANGTAVKSGACRFKGIAFGGGNAAAGDYALIYDASSATGTPKFDISVGTAKETIVLSIPGGVKFSTGIFVKADAVTDASVATVWYDD